MIAHIPDKIPTINPASAILVHPFFSIIIMRKVIFLSDLRLNVR